MNTQAYPDAPLPEPQEPCSVCADCGGTGLRDLGGFHPWGEPTMIECDCGAYTWPESGGRESVEDALRAVESFGPGIDGVNDTYARQIILANEVKRLRKLYEQAVSGRKALRGALRALLKEQT